MDSLTLDRQIMYHKFRQKVEKYPGINSADKQFIEKLVELSRVKKASKYDVPVRQGDISSELYFVNRGVLMLRYVEKHHEKACDFFFENDFAASFDSFENQKESDFYLEVLADAELLVWKYRDLIALENEPSYHKIAHFMARELYFNENRLKTMLIAYPAKKMYEVLQHDFPHITEQVPLRYVAEFMGITPEHLSRLRKKT